MAQDDEFREFTMENGPVRLSVRLTGPANLIREDRSVQILRERMAQALDQFADDPSKQPQKPGQHGASAGLGPLPHPAQFSSGPEQMVYGAVNANLDSDRMPDLSGARPHHFPGGFKSPGAQQGVPGNLIGPQAFDTRNGSPIRGGGIQPPPGGPDGLDGQIPLPPGARGSPIVPRPQPDDFQGGPVHPYYM